MRLIDADKIMGCAKYIKVDENFEPYITIDDLAKLLDEQPIAYDIGNVVEELEEMIHPNQLYFCKYAKGGCRHLDNDDKDCMECVVENAIEIVKHGGVGKGIQ